MSFADCAFRWGPVPTCEISLDLNAIDGALTALARAWGEYAGDPNVIGRWSR